MYALLLSTCHTGVSNKYVMVAVSPDMYWDLSNEITPPPITGSGVPVGVGVGVIVGITHWGVIGT